MNKPTKPNRLDVWGNSMLNQCSSRLRNRRKRCASKKRRVALKANDEDVTMTDENVTMNFGKALEELKKGSKCRRSGWNGKNMYLIYVEGTKNAPLREGTPYHSALNCQSYGQSTVTINPHIDMFTAQGDFQPGWLASQTDMLAEDWVSFD